MLNVRWFKLVCEERVLQLFRRTVEEVPAYREFLAARGADPVAVKTFADFERLSLLTKQNYINTYPLPARCCGGTSGPRLLRTLRYRPQSN
jgi:phenylacetate-CoA ligase